jgi:aspartyl-tRNA(Asn)/glutamyl-tRNA(Gln) amidotransferase subunit C
MKVDRDTILRAAELAKLKLTEEETHRMLAQLESILEYVRILEELDLDEVTPTAHTLGYKNRTRDDTAGKSFDVKDVEELAPRWSRGHVTVPRIV